MIVELALVFLVTTHLGHLLERIKHCLHNLIVSGIDALSDLEGIRADELRFHATDVGREVLDERSNTFPLLAGELGLLDRFNVVSLYMRWVLVNSDVRINVRL